MRLARVVRTACCALALTAMLAPAARADEYTKTTHLTFSGPVQIPGMTLQAGTYTFKLADPESGRRTIQIWDKEGGNLLATLLTIPDQMLEPADEPVVLFSEQPAGSPQAVKAWFYPGDRIGQEFVYPKDQAMKIAAANRTSVLAYNSDDAKLDAEALRKAEVARVDAQGQAAQSTTASTAATASSTTSSTTAATARTAEADASAATASASSTPPATANRSQAGNAVGTSGTVDTAPSSTAQSSAAQQPAASQPSTTAQQPGAPARPSTTAPAPAADQSQTTARAEALPRTASPIALFGMLSALSLAGAVGVRQLRRRYAANR
jgi:hypothetical protein